MRQMDIKSAYLHPEHKEKNYLEQPQGFEKLEKGKNLSADWKGQFTV